MNYLLDTNVFSKYIQNKLSKSGLALLDSLADKRKLNFSIVSRIELLSWKTAKSSEQALKFVLSQSTEFGLTEKIIDRTIELKRKYKIKLPDAIIAATCLVHRMVLLTDNEQDFNKIPTLKFQNPVQEIKK